MTVLALADTRFGAEPPPAHPRRRRRPPGRPGTDRGQSTLQVTVSVRLEPGADQDRVVRALRELALAGGTRIVDSDPAPASSAPSAPAGSADVRIHAGTRTVLRAGAPLPLSRLEYDLLHFLATHPRQVFTRLQLLGQVWGHTGAGARTVDVHVRRLRMKVGPDVPVVTTVHGVGYRLADGAPIVVDAD